MAQFSKIIGALLSDIIQAQHEANLYAESLREEYRKGGKVGGFTLPRATIGDIELNLNYGVENAVSEREQFETDYRRLHSFLKDFSCQASKVLISHVVNSVKAADVAGRDEAQRVWSLLSDERKEYRKLLVYLSRKIYSDAVCATDTFIDEQGSVLAGPLVNLSCDTARNNLLFLPDLEVLFSGRSGNKLRAEVENSMADVLRPFVVQLVSELNFVNKRIVSGADVIVDAKGLEKIPVECVQSIRLKLKLPDFAPYVEPDNKE